MARQLGWGSSGPESTSRDLREPIRVSVVGAVPPLLVELLRAAGIVLVAPFPSRDDPGNGPDLVIYGIAGDADPPAPDLITKLSRETPTIMLAPRHTSFSEAAARVHVAGCFFWDDSRRTLEMLVAAVRGCRPSAPVAPAVPQRRSPDPGAACRASAGEEMIRLSPRERETLHYIARGFTHQQAANRMGVSRPTVDTFVARIRTKLGIGNKAELTMAALSHLGQSALTQDPPSLKQTPKPGRSATHSPATSTRTMR
jgi:DNA-binding NarL/FixJ family response regulator